MKFIIAIVIVATLHMVFTVMLSFYLGAAAMTSYDTMAPPSATEKVVSTLVDALSFPLIWPSEALQKYFPEWSGYILFALNSLAQSIVLGWIVRAIARHYRRRLLRAQETRI